MRHSLPLMWTLYTMGLAFVTPAHAQMRIEAGPLVGFYGPVGDFKAAPYYSTALPNSPSDLSGAAWGAQGQMWFNGRVGVQLQLAMASSTVGGGNTPAGSMSPTPARVLTVSGQALLALTSAARPSCFWLSAGPGLVRHEGNAYARYGSPVQFASALGFGSTIALGSHFGANLGVTTFFYNIDVSDSSGTSLEHGFQVDPLFHLGLSLR